MLDVLSIGNANIDIYPGKEFFPGGSANNFAVNCARLGLKSGFLGFVGNDKNGKLIIGNLKKNKVKSFIKTIDEKTGTVKILSKGFKKKFEKSLGANKELKKLKLKPYFKTAKHIHLATPPIELLKQLTPELSVSIDSGSALSKYSLSTLEPYLKNISIFFANEAEAKKITGKECETAANDFLNAGIKIIVIKKAKTGIYIKTEKQEIKIKYLKAKIVDSTGAGDALASAFIQSMLKGKSIKEAGKAGIIFSTNKMKFLGAQSSQKTK
ncbi:MAG: PfkB family carbohydrate kinase [Candidatus Nanoarchaeia archaeon]|nr:PfkB family carbohydrate kinase [Candidatus Nanoarchaeia archaeon]